MTRQLAAEFGPPRHHRQRHRPHRHRDPHDDRSHRAAGGDAYRKQQADALPIRRMAVPQDCGAPPSSWPAMPLTL